MKKQAIVNIYHFIRKSTYEDGLFTQEDFDTLKNEMDLLKQHQLPATYALKYDALMNDEYTNLIKETIDEKDEVGAWWEITEELARKAGVLWKGRDVIDLNVKAGYSLAYLPWERKALLDVYMEDFKLIYGTYPKTIGSWVMDIVTFDYAKEKYGVIGGALCRDQRGIDGFTLWGGYMNGAYYPSKVNEYMPAQTKENQLDMPLFRLLGPDPIYNFESEIRDGAEGIYTLEPAWISGQSKEWVHWLFSCITEEDQLGYGYAQVGQENSYIWGTVGEAFEMQIRHVAQLRKENKVRVESLRDSALWFLAKYNLTPPTTYSASQDWNKQFDLKTTWYSSRFYRTSFLWDQGELSIRDWYLFDETYPSRYLNDYITHNESVFDALPILNTHEWSTKEKRVGIHFAHKQSGKLLRGDAPSFNGCEEDKEWYIQWPLEDGRSMRMICEQDRMICKMEGSCQEEESWVMVMDTLPVLVAMEPQKLICKHETFPYRLQLQKGHFEKQGDQIVVVPENGELVILMAQEYGNGVAEFLTSTYLQDPKTFEEKVTAPRVCDEEKLRNVKLVKPIMSHANKVKKYDETLWCEIENINEDGQVHYTQDGTEPTLDSPVYTGPIAIQEDVKIKACCFATNRRTSDTAQAKYVNTLPIEELITTTQFDPRKVFNRKGIYDLVDGQKGSLNFADGSWLGTQESLVVTADLGRVRSVKKVEIGFLQSKRSGLCYPEYVEYAVSKDGIHFEIIDKQEVYVKSGDPDMENKDVSVSCECEARYVKITAQRAKHFLFIDQIVIQ